MGDIRKLIDELQKFSGLTSEFTRMGSTLDRIVILLEEISEKLGE